MPPRYSRYGGRIRTHGGTDNVDPVEIVYGRGFRNKFKEETAQYPAAPERVWIWFPGHYDAADTYGGGSSDWMTTPGSIINYLASCYAGTGFTTSPSTTFGSVKYFDSIMQAWAKLHDTSVGKFELFWWTHDKRSVAETLDNIYQELPGMARHSIGPTGTRTLVATGSALGQFSSKELDYGHHSSWNDGISLEDIIVVNGVPCIEQQFTPLSSIINDIEVNYQYDPATGKYGATAFAKAGESDDGFGNPWPTSLGGMSAGTLCYNSQHIYTNDEPRKKTINLKFHWQSNTAVAMGLWDLWRYWRPFVTLRICASVGLQDLVPGQLFKMNDDIRTVGGFNCAIPHRNAVTWKDGIYFVGWHCLSNTRRYDPSIGVYQEIYGMEHLQNISIPGGGKIEGGEPFAGEGFIL